ncbi:zinc-dependent metalloprotease family protein [Pseudomonas entomophila]|uniref:zinc-dependent metalloprotease family protein n=1 Tax=Pseudomonas entomophila TaxID=312306 RepID=UPI00200C6B54|nr:zinc-dependent metalloprotease family protein [Pseudomonas entomophila]
MSTIFNASLAASVLILALGCSVSKPVLSAGVSAEPNLFTLEPTLDRKSLQSNATGELAKLLADPANAEVTFVRVDSKLINQQTRDLAISLPGGKVASFSLRDYTTITPGIVGWVGYKTSMRKQTNGGAASEIEVDPLFYLSLVRENHKLVGDLIVEGQRYSLQPLGSEQHVLIKIDESKLPPEAEPLEPSGSATRGGTVGKLPLSAHSTIRVMFLATNQRKEQTSNYKAQLALALNNANQYMSNSGVQITYELAGYYEGGYDETGRDYSEQLNDIRLAQPFAQQVLAKREELRADMVSMYSTNPKYCGMAWLTASKVQAHSVVSCPGSLAHELGHNLGVNHGWKEGDSVRNPPYMHGYSHDSAPAFHTIMVTSHGAIPFFSNPRLQYMGVPMGTTEYHDAARRFNERRETVENFYP